MIADRVNSAHSGRVISFKRGAFVQLWQSVQAPSRVGRVCAVRASLGREAKLPFLFTKKIEIVLYFTF